MQKINLFEIPKVSRSTLTPDRFILAVCGILVAFGAVGLWSDSRTAQAREQLAEVAAQRDARSDELQMLQAVKPPVADAALTGQISELETFRGRLIAVRDTLLLHSTVTTAELVRALDAIEEADTYPVWLERIQLHAKGGAENRLQGRALNSDAISRYLPRVERAFEPLDWQLTQIAVTDQGEDTVRFDLILRGAGGAEGAP